MGLLELIQWTDPSIPFTVIGAALMGLLVKNAAAPKRTAAATKKTDLFCRVDIFYNLLSWLSNTPYKTDHPDFPDSALR
jgi:hypothetical protein